MSYRVKTNYDRGYMNAMDKVRVFIESNQKVMYVNTDEYKMLGMHVRLMPMRSRCFVRTEL